jgi:hypothetical protein
MKKIPFLKSFQDDKAALTNASLFTNKPRARRIGTASGHHSHDDTYYFFHQEK